MSYATMSYVGLNGYAIHAERMEDNPEFFRVSILYPNMAEVDVRIMKEELAIRYFNSSVDLVELICLKMGV